MNRDWHDFKALYGNIAGARDAFENACETLYREKYKDIHVSKVEVKKGDGGIDIFIGEYGIEPITVIQCKFFLETFEESQKSQIRESFKTANTSALFEMKEWILCVPRVICNDENSWWFTWKHKQLEEFNKPADFIQLVNGNELIDLFKTHNIYNLVFQMEDSLKIDEMYSVICPKKNISQENNDPKLVLFNNYTVCCDPFYIQRKQDTDFINFLKINNLWVYGLSGSGKTALLNRNILINNLEHCYCDLSPISIHESDDVLLEILSTIEDNFNIVRNSDESNKIKQITQLLNKIAHCNTIIVIDELAVDDETLLRDIMTQLSKLVTYFNNQNGVCNLRFIISTINAPSELLSCKLKSIDFFQYINCTQWNINFSELFDHISNSLDININTYKDEIILLSKDSPRILKMIFKKLIYIDCCCKESVQEVLKQTRYEVVE